MVIALIIGLERGAGANDKDMVRLDKPESQRRVALVIGNGRYEYVSSLQGPPNDAEVVARSLRDVGFEVQMAKNLNYREFVTAVADFAERATGAEVALVYYSGHGLQVEGENYLVPVDADIRSPAYIRAYAIALEDLLARMDYSGAHTRIIVLDACRNNPFSNLWYTQQKSSTPSGLAPVNATGGFFIAYATAPGAVAQDAQQGAGAYSLALADALSVPGEELNAVFRRVGASVQTSTSGRQVPWISSSLTAPFYFRQAQMPAVSTDSSAPPAPPASQPSGSTQIESVLTPQMGIGFEWSVNDPYLWNRGVRVSVGLELRGQIALEMVGAYYASVVSDSDLTPFALALINDVHLVADFSRLQYRGGVSMRFTPIEGRMWNARTFIGGSVGVGLVRTEDDEEASQVDGYDERFDGSQFETHATQGLGLQSGLEIGAFQFSLLSEMFCYVETVSSTLLEKKCPALLGFQLGVLP